MKKYISLQQGFNIDLLTAAKLAKQAGFDGCFLSCEEGNITVNDINNIKNIGFDIETIHLRYFTDSKRRIVTDLWDDNEYALESYNILCSNIDIAYKGNIKTVILHSSGSFIQNPPSLHRLKWFNKLADYAKERNIDIAIENIKSMEYFEFLVNNIKKDNVYVCFDIGHANAFTKNLNTFNWDPYFKKVKCVHLHDNDVSWDQHLIPGLGNINFVKYLKQIYNYNKNLNLTLELYYKGRESIYGKIDPLDFYKKAYEAISKIEEKIYE